MAGGRIKPAGVVAAAAGLAVLVTGCGGGSKSPSVASLGGTTTGSTATGQTGSGPVKNGASFNRFVHCMQQHGIQAQLGPNGHGVSITGADPNSSQMARAQTACSKLLPGGGPKALTPAQQAQMIRQLVELASCMRKHGFPSFPDPDSQGTFDFTRVNGIDPGSTQFQQAMSACKPNGGNGHLRIGIRVSGPGSGPKGG